MMVHEVPDQRRLLGEIQACLKPGGKLLVAEPKIHVPGKAFGETVALAGEVGLKVVEEPRVRGCRAVVLVKVVQNQPSSWVQAADASHWACFLRHPRPKYARPTSLGRWAC